MKELVERVTARVLPVDPSGRVLLLHGWRPERPDEPFWFTVGGGVEPGESLAEAAARELAEETGIRVGPAELGAAIGEFDHEFDWGRSHIRQRETYFAHATGEVEVTLAGLDEIERDTTDRAEWWAPGDLVTAGERIYPEIVELMRLAVSLHAPSS